MMNTYSSILASVMATFVVSSLSNVEGKLHIDHIQNAVLAGGVAVGAVADILLEPYVAIILGLVGGLASTCGFLFLPDFFTFKLRVHDTCSVHSLHAIPGLLGLYKVKWKRGRFSFPIDEYWVCFISIRPRLPLSPL